MAASLKKTACLLKLFRPSQHHVVWLLRVTGLADKQSDLTEDFKGPARKLPWIVMETSPKQLKDLSVGGLTVEDIEFREIKG